MTAAPRVSVAVPLLDEEANVPELLRRLGAVLDDLPGGPHEVVLVDDGSTDGTPALLADAAARDPRLVVVTLSRNFGHQVALAAALDHAEGDVVLVMDGDLQDPPEVLPRFLEHHAEGYDVVYARRVRRKEPWHLRAGYFLYYRLLARLASPPLPVDAGDFALLSRRVVDELRRLPERHRYLRGLRSWVGFRQLGIEVERDERGGGRSKYGLRDLLRLGGDGLFAFTTLPLRAASALGSLAVLGSTVFAVYAVVVHLFLDRSPRGFTALIVTIVFLAGVQLLFLGVIGEYLGRVYDEVKARPHYVVKSVTRGRS